MHLIVDAMNVIGSRPNGWWRDREGAARRLLGRLQRLAATTGDEVTAVLDGRPNRAMPEGADEGVMVLWANRRGPDAADDRIIELVREAEAPETMLVVTSDRALRERVEALGANVEGASMLLRRLDALEQETDR
jgi:predicted RNA-binding protein with PIN domain